MKGNISIITNVKWVLNNADGSIAAQGEKSHTHNVDCKLHGVMVANRMVGGVDTLISYGHAGTGNGQTAQSTNLAAPFAENRTALTSKTQGAGNDANDVVYIYTLGLAACVGTITELGLFVLQAHATVDMQFYYDDGATLSIVKSNAQTLTVTWTVTHGESPV